MRALHGLWLAAKESMMKVVERCVGCNAEVEVIEGPIHRYMTSAPACWKRYGELLAVLYSQPANQKALIMCVDTAVMFLR
jgi:hypothetical protein